MNNYSPSYTVVGQKTVEHAVMEGMINRSVAYDYSVVDVL